MGRTQLGSPVDALACCACAAQGQEKMSKSDPNSAIFMEDAREDVDRKIKKAFCPPQVTTGTALHCHTQYLSPAPQAHGQQELAPSHPAACDMGLRSDHYHQLGHPGKATQAQSVTNRAKQCLQTCFRGWLSGCELLNCTFMLGMGVVVQALVNKAY